ncbi:MAG TPA: leucyl aminopeptidase [Candidatus Baltobacteraceae bacterium]|nr:leucyl aminopeptidase [Candidatus Baltobacteraceae bacterium]
MQIRVVSDSLDTQKLTALVVPVFSDRRLDGIAAQLDAMLGGAITDLYSSGEIAGKSGERAFLHTADRSIKRVLVIGLGEREKFEASALVRYAGAAVRHLGKLNIHSLAFALPLEAQHHVRQSASCLIEGAIAGILDTTIYRTEPDHPIQIDEIILLAHTDAHTFQADALTEGAKRGRILGEAINFTRTLALRPGNEMTPIHLATAAKEISRTHGLAYHVLDEDQMHTKKMGAILGVSRGSDEPARMIVLEYTGDPSSKEKLALVGKGITFDSGGISIKPRENMEDMKYDMCGGAAVIGAMSVIGQLRPKINVLGVVPASENLPGPRATKPGDIHRAMNGKTIEVNNTDAEGRLVLADALCYARELGATRIIDAATLTGAMVISLGHVAVGTMGNDEDFIKHFLRIANTTGERFWHLPLYEEFATIVKSEIADLRNSAGRPAGSLTAGKFLETFVDKTPWIHLDIAGTAYLGTESAHQAKGPTAVPLRAFVAFVEDLAHNGIAKSNSSTEKLHPAART